MLGGFLGGLANLGTAYGGYLGAQNQATQNAMNQLRLQQALQQQTSAQDAWAVAQKGLNQYFPGGGLGMPWAQPSTATPGTTPTPTPLQPLTTAPVTPIQTPQLPNLSPLQQAAAGPLNLGGIPGGGPLGIPGLPGMSGFGGGTITPTGLPEEQASLAGFPSLGLGRPAAPLADTGSPFGPSLPATFGGRGTISPAVPSWQTADNGLGPPPGVSDIYADVITLEPPQLQGLGGGPSIGRMGTMPLGQPPALSTPARGGIVQPAGGFGLPTGYMPTPPQAPAAPQTVDAGTAAVPGTADTGSAAPPGANIAAQISSILQQRGWSQAAIQGALANGMAESGLQPWGATGASGEQGIWQMNPSGELPAYQKAYGDSRSVADQTNYMADRVEQTMPQYARLTSATAATDAFMSGFERPKEAVPGSRYQFLGQADRANAVNSAVLSSRQIWAQSTTPQEKQGSSIGTMSILQRYPFLAQQIGTFDMDRLVKTIDQTYPNESPGVKLGIFNNLFGLLHPIAKEQYAQTIDLVKTDIAEQQRAETQRATEEYRKTALGLRGQALEDQPLGGPVQTDSGWVQPMRSGPPRPLPGTPVGIATAQARVEADPRKSAFEAYKTEYAATHGGKQPPAQDQAAFMRQLYVPRSGPGMTLQAFMQQFQEENGRPPNADEIRQFQSETAAMTSEARTIGTAGANVDIQAAKAEALIPLVKEKSRAISRTNYPDINSLILAYETRTGDPDVVQYGELVNSLRYTYAGVMARGGQARVADIQHFDEIFNKAWSTDQVDAALDQMQTTINRERQAILKTRGQVGKPTGQREGAAPAAPTPGGKTSVEDIAKMSPDELRYLMQPEQAKALTDQQKIAIGARIQELKKQGMLPESQ